MLFQGCLSSLERALSGFGQEDPAQANMTIHNNLHRAQQIIRELDLALNMEQGGAFAITLRDLYRYFDRRLLESNTRKSRQGIEEVIGHLTVLRDAWATMLNQPTPAPAEPRHEPALALAPA